MNYTPEQLKDFRDAIDAHLAGKPVETRVYGSDGEWDVTSNPAWSSSQFYRPKPEPKTRPWSKKADFPDSPTVWLRLTQDARTEWQVSCVCALGVHLPSSCFSDPMKCWSEVDRNYEYSTDRKAWQKCEVTEG